MDDDQKVVPIGRRRRDTPAAAPDRRVHPATRRAAGAARDLAAEQNTYALERHADAARRQRDDRLLARGTPVPARITMALGDRSGPEVDLAVGTFEGNPAGDVDAWEDPDDWRLPDGRQVRLLAEYTGYPIAWFYKPYTPIPSRMTICWRDRRGCETFDDDGVIVPPGKQPGQHTLPGMPAVPEAAPAPAPRSSSARRPSSLQLSTARNTPVPAPEQPMLPSRMPDHLRAELMAKLAAARESRT